MVKLEAMGAIDGCRENLNFDLQAWVAIYALPYITMIETR